MGMYEDFVPKHTKRYANIAQVMRKAGKNYLREVREGAFPGPEHSLDMNNAIKPKSAGSKRKP